MAARKPRTYGSKKTTAALGSSAIFGRGASPVENVRVGVADSEAGPVDEVTALLAKSRLDSKGKGKQTKPAPSRPSNDIFEALSPLLTAHKVDTGSELELETWSSILPASCTIHKIAEASYAEVYRVNVTPHSSSIIKILQLKVTSDEASLEIDTANDVSSVISEIRIMNALTEIPGFVTFKATYLVQGRPPRSIVSAYDEHSAEMEDDSYFPHPSTFGPKSTFLVLELGDAGEVLEKYCISTIEQVWDVLLSVIMALSRAEITNEFEHRDLHENNICVRYVTPSVSVSAASSASGAIKDTDSIQNPTEKGDIKFGFSGLHVTLIDYGLSRAKLASGELIFNDLEQDLVLFHSESDGVPGIQFDTYRRMRTLLATQERAHNPTAFHHAPIDPTPWSTFEPYNNVLWIRYIYAYLLATFKYYSPLNSKTKNSQIALFKKQTKDLTRGLNPLTKAGNGAFSAAEDVLGFVADMGWVSNEQLERFGGGGSEYYASTFIDGTAFLERQRNEGNDGESDTSDGEKPEGREEEGREMDLGEGKGSGKAKLETRSRSKAKGKEKAKDREEFIEDGGANDKTKTKSKTKVKGKDKEEKPAEGKTKGKGIAKAKAKAASEEAYDSDSEDD